MGTTIQICTSDGHGFNRASNVSDAAAAQLAKERTFQLLRTEVG